MRVLRHTGRWTWYAGVAIVALLAIVFAAARLLLPGLAEKKADLEAYLSRVSAHAVRIEKLDAYWEGLHPGLRAQGLAVYAADAVRPAIRLSEVRLTLALTPLLWGGVEIHSLELAHPALSLERLADGRFRVSGFDPIRAAEPGQGEKFLDWLFQQNRLAITDGELQWFDHREPARALHLKRANLSLRNSGERHRLELSAELPAGVCRECTVTADVTGNPLFDEHWGGEITLRAQDVRTEALPRVVREYLPEAFRGSFTVQLWSQWKEARPREVQGVVSVLDLAFPLRGFRAPIALRQAQTRLRWEAEDDGWRLDLADLTLGLSGPSWSPGRLSVRQQKSALEAEVQHVNLSDISAFVAGLRRSAAGAGAKDALFTPPQDELLALWAALRPEGALDRLKLRLVGEPGAPDDVSLAVDLTGVSTQPHEDLPGAVNVSGKLSLTRGGGALQLDTADASLALPRVFRAPIPVARARGHLTWEKKSDHWLVTGRDLSAANEDGQGSGTLALTLPLDPAQSPRLKLQVDFRDGNGARAARYYPARHLEPDTLAWMERAFAGGEIVSGHLLYDGPIREFPFDAGNGRFEIEGRVRHGVYHYLPGWEPVREAEVDVAIRGREVLVAGRGRIGGLPLKQVAVRTEGAGAARNVRVSGRLAGPVNETLRVLREVRAAPGADEWKLFLPAGLKGTGQGALGLDITVPLDESPVRVAGEYRFLNGGLVFADWNLGYEGISGELRFTEAGVREGALHGRLLGGETTVAIAAGPGGTTAVAKGDVALPAAASFLGPRLAPRVTGHVPWNARLHWNKAPGDFYAEADLAGLRLAFPAPLDRPQGLPGEKLVVKTESSARDALAIVLDVGRAAHGRLLFRREGAWHLASGHIAFGDVQGSTSVAGGRTPGATAGLGVLPGGPGLHLSAHLDALDIDPWLPLLGGGRAQAPATLTRLSAQIGAFDMAERAFGELALDLRREKTGWSGTVAGQTASGRIRFTTAQPILQIELELAHLAVPGRTHRETAAAGLSAVAQAGETDPRRLPGLVIRSQSFQNRGHEFGALDFAAVPTRQGWRIDRFNLTRPETEIKASGDWRIVAEKPESAFAINVRSEDFGKTLEAWGIPDQMAGGAVTLAARLSWPGSPANAELNGMNGEITLAAKNGRFVQLSPGASRFLGILDLSAIGRALILDFDPLFGKGFVFDEIGGRMELERGNAYARDLSIKGASARIAIDGRAGLAAEDFDLVIRIEPLLRDTAVLPLTTVLGPQVTAWVYAFKKIFGGEISKGASVTYMVKGPWKAPAVTKAVKGAEAKARAGGSPMGE